MNDLRISDVPDSTDWLATPLRALAGVEAALRCQVCKDFFTTPMITSCGHTFCSGCIRKSLSQDGRCPACRAGDQEVKLKHNNVVEDAVEAFTAGREAMMAVARSAESGAEAAAAAARHREGSAIATAQAKRKSSAVEEADGNAPRKRPTRASSRIAQSQQGQEVEIIDSDEDVNDDDDFFPSPAEPVDDGLLSCPVCQGRMTLVQIDQHIDRCTGVPPVSRPSKAHQAPLHGGPVTKLGLGTTTTPTTTTHKTKVPERIAPINYGTVRDQQLRKKLAEHGLATGGARPLMEKRYTEWVILVNANCDARRPRSRKELARDLDTWERTLGSRAPQATTMGSNGGAAAAAQIGHKDFDAKAWRDKHEDTFRDLVVSARRKIVKAIREPVGEDPPGAASARDGGSPTNGTSTAPKPSPESFPDAMPAKMVPNSDIAGELACDVQTPA